MLSLNLTHRANNFLNGLDSKQFRQVVRKIFSLLENPKPGDARSLQGYPFWRADIGEYRIIYRIEQQTLNVEIIDKRNDDEVYKKLGRIS